MIKSIKEIIMVLFAAIFCISLCVTSLPEKAHAATSVEKPYLVKSCPSKKVLKLNWNRTFASVSGVAKRATGYEVQYSVLSTFKSVRAFKYDGTVKEIKYTLPKQSSSYYARVRAIYSSNGKTFYSGWRVAKTKVNMTKINYIGFTLSAVKNDIKAKYNAQKGVTYKFYRRNEDGTWRLLLVNSEALGGSRTFTDASRFYDAAYMYLITAHTKITTKTPNKYNASPLITKTSTAKALAVKNPLQKPVITGYKFEDDTLTFSWLKDINARGYIYEYADNIDMENSKAETTTKTTAVIKELSPEKIYYVRVLSYVDIRSDGVTKNFTSEFSDVTKAAVTTYTVKFDKNSGKGTMKDIKITAGEKSALPANAFTRPGYTFVGWSTKKGTTPNMVRFQYGVPTIKNGEEVRDLAPVGRTVTLYACWKGAGPEAAADWAVRIAKDNDFTYGTGKDSHHNGCFYCGTNQNGKYGKPKGNKYAKTYCCNPFVYAAYCHGANKFTTCIGSGLSINWWANLTSGGKKLFKKVGYNTKFSSLKRGDIMVKNNKHIRIYLGPTDDGRYKVVHAAQEGFNAKSIRVDYFTDKTTGPNYYALKYIG